MFFNLVERDGSKNITAFINGEMLVADENHPRLNDLVQAAIADDERAFLDAHDASVAAAIKFQALSDRVVVRSSRVYVDQTEVEGAFADQIMRFLEDDDADWRPLVLFLEKVYSNVDESVRENLSRWLAAEQFTLLDNGNILGYRGLRQDFTSVHAGPGIVNGVEVNGHLDNSVGNTVELDVDKVTVDPAVGCAPGLHVGTYDYASNWGHGVVVSVEVNPIHVRSVPFECASAKMRVSQYKVLDRVTSKNDSLTVALDIPEVVNEFEVQDEDSDDYVEGYIDGYDDRALGNTPKY